MPTLLSVVFFENGLAAAAAVCTRRRRETWIS